MSVSPDSVGGVHGAGADTEIQIIFQCEVTDDFSFAFVSPEGSDYNYARHPESPLKGFLEKLFNLLDVFVPIVVIDIEKAHAFKQ